MLNVMEALNAPQISRDRKKEWLDRAMGVTALAMAGLTYWAIFWVIPKAITAFYDAATFTSPLGG